MAKEESILIVFYKINDLERNKEAMNVSKDGKTLYFSDDEISKDVEGEKQVFVTKRINGKETHVKKEDRNKAKKKNQQSLSYDTFSFDNEVVIGVNSPKDEENETQKKGTKKKNSGKHKKKEKVNRNSSSKNKSEKNEKDSKKSSKNNLHSQKNGKNKTKKTQRNDYNKQDEKEYKSKKKSHKLLIGIITTIILIAIIIVISLTTPLFNITSIVVTGNEKISSDTIISLSRFKKRRKYF